MADAGCTSKGIIGSLNDNKRFEVFIDYIHFLNIGVKTLDARIVAYNEGATWLFNQYDNNTKFLFEAEVKDKSNRKLTVEVQCFQIGTNVINQGYLWAKLTAYEWHVIKGALAKSTIKKEKVLFI